MSGRVTPITTLVAPYPPFDGTQACLFVDERERSGFVGPDDADPVPAVEVCEGCGFVEACRDYALTHDVVGVWGGLSDQDRWTVRGRRRQPRPIRVSDELDSWVKEWRTSRPARRTAA